MLEQVDALPGAEGGRAIHERDGEVRLGERRTDVGRHVVRPLHRVAIDGVIFGHQAGEERLEVVQESGSAFSWIVRDAEVWRL